MSRWNNLCFSGLIEQTEDTDMWKEIDKPIKEFTKAKLELKSKNIIIKRTHRASSRTSSKKQSAIIINFLNFKSNVLSWTNIEERNSGGTTFTSMRIADRAQKN